MTEIMEAQIARIDERTEAILKAAEKMNETVIVLDRMILNHDRRITRVETIIKICAWAIGSGSMVTLLVFFLKLIGGAK